MAQGTIKEFLKAGGGVIVNTASMYGWVGSPGSAEVPLNITSEPAIRKTKDEQYQ